MTGQVPSSWRSGSEPWAVHDVSRYVLLCGIGLLAQAGCWVGISGTGSFDAQAGWLAAAIAAAVLVLLAGAQFLLAGTRNVQSAQRTLTPLLRTRAAVAPIGTASAAEPARGTRVASPAMTRHHAPDCQLVRGKAVLTLNAAGMLTRRPCGVCA